MDWDSPPPPSTHPARERARERTAPFIHTDSVLNRVHNPLLRGDTPLTPADQLMNLERISSTLLVFFTSSEMFEYHVETRQSETIGSERLLRARRRVGRGEACLLMKLPAGFVPYYSLAQHLVRCPE